MPVYMPSTVETCAVVVTVCFLYSAAMLRASMDVLTVAPDVFLSSSARLAMLPISPGPDCETVCCSVIMPCANAAAFVAVVFDDAAMIWLFASHASRSGSLPTVPFCTATIKACCCCTVMPEKPFILLMSLKNPFMSARPCTSCMLSETLAIFRPITVVYVVF